MNTTPPPMTDPGIDADAVDVLDFWFGQPGDAHYVQTRVEWFRKDAAFDALIRERFGSLIDSAITGSVWRA